MLQNIKELYGSKLAASDGDIGQAKDFYFDDNTWAIRYIVADTGSWLTGRQVLLAPHAFGRFDRADKILPVNLTRKQIEDSPSIDTHRPVSRQYEEEYYRYYGQPAYWQSGGISGVADFPAVIPPSIPVTTGHHGHNQRDDVHLRSTKALTGYEIEASDGAIGSVSGFMVNTASWDIRDLVVEAGHWYSGKEILIAAGKVWRISYEKSTVFVNLTKADIQHTAEHEVAKAGA
jgi:hypothetical protein